MKKKTTSDRQRKHYLSQQLPDPLQYLWMQLDENEHSSINNPGYVSEGSLPRSLDDGDLNKIKANKGDNGYGFNITKTDRRIRKSYEISHQQNYDAY
ncbi:MAG: hypothetical protein IPP89_00470 [Saprospiraceae bacterium]|nr:hypothetical protein [Candidatus Brachybacter algidus]MBL0117483.1 hypothetical protein [Candidatus Brachybacter algidus]